MQKLRIGNTPTIQSPCYRDLFSPVTCVLNGEDLPNLKVSNNVVVERQRNDRKNI